MKASVSILHVVYILLCMSGIFLLNWGLQIYSEWYMSKHASETDKFFSDFSNYDRSISAHYRVGAETDTNMCGFHIKAITTAFFDSMRYSPTSVYILKHVSGKSLVINTDDVPLLWHFDFADFYENNKSKSRADTIISPRFFDKFYVAESDTVKVESFQWLPFVFMDVNFDGSPELLVRKGADLYRYDAYDIKEDGIKMLDFEPYLSIKSRCHSWSYGGSTQFDFKNKTITVFSLSPQSCSDYGSSIKEVYTYNPSTGTFDYGKFVNKYDFNE